MFVVGIAAGLLLRVSDGDDGFLSRIHASKAALETCMFSHAAQMYHGTADQQLERAVVDSCSHEFDEMVEAETVGLSPQGRAAAKANIEPLILMAAHLAVQAAAMPGK